MQDRYAGDVGDYVKLALLRSLASDAHLGVAWYLYPDEAHNSDGRHVSYLDRPSVWRDLDPDLFDALSETVRNQRTVIAIEKAGVLQGARFSREPVPAAALKAAVRSDERKAWFGRTISELAGCDIVFADPDNGLIDDAPRRRRQAKFGKQMPLGEARALADGRTAIIYHHNTRYPGGHDLEVAFWKARLGTSTIAVRANAYNCRTFFVLNPTPAIRTKAAEFCGRWSGHRVRFCDWVC